MPTGTNGRIAMALWVCSLVCLAGLLCVRVFVPDSNMGGLDTLVSLGVLFLWIASPVYALRAWVQDHDRGWMLVLTPAPLVLALGSLLIVW